MRWRRTERGQTVIGEAILVVIALVGAAAIVAWGINSYEQAHQSERIKRLQAEEARRAREAALDPPFIGPALPNASEPRECVQAKFAEHQLTYTTNGWRRLGNPEPERTGNLQHDVAALAAWKTNMENYVKQFEFEIDQCVKDRVQLRDPGVAQPSSSSSSLVKATWYGHYAVSQTFQSPRECVSLEGADWSVSQDGPTVTILMGWGGNNLTFSGTVDSGGYFEFSNPQSNNPPPPTMAVLRGFFSTFGTQKLIRSGLFDVTTSSISCSYGFEARTST